MRSRYSMRESGTAHARSNTKRNNDLTVLHRQRVSLCVASPTDTYRTVPSEFYEITFIYDTLHLLLTHHDNHASFIYTLLPIHASISIRILTLYHFEVKYLSLHATTDRSISSKGTNESQYRFTISREQRPSVSTQFDTDCEILVFPWKIVRQNFNRYGNHAFVYRIWDIWHRGNSRQANISYRWNEFKYVYDTGISVSSRRSRVSPLFGYYSRRNAVHNLENVGEYVETLSKCSAGSADRKLTRINDYE